MEAKWQKKKVISPTERNLYMLERIHLFEDKAEEEEPNFRDDHLLH